MGCHFLDLAYWALNLGHPSTVAAEGPPVDADSAPEWLKVRYEYPADTSGDAAAAGGGNTAATGGGRYRDGPITVTWSVGFKRLQDVYTGETPALQLTGGAPVPHDTGRMPVLRELPDWKEGVLFVGDEGMLVADFNRLKLLPAERFAGVAPPPRSIPNSIGHHREFIEACKGNGRASCPFDYAGVLTQAVLLGNVAYRAGRKIEWDAENMAIPNAPEAERYLRRPHLNGWDLPSL